MTPHTFTPLRANRIAVFAVVLLASFLATACTKTEAPAVDQLVDHYAAHRADFQRIAALSSINATFGIDVDQYGAVGRGIETSTVAEYSAPLTGIGVEHVDVSDHELDVTVHSEGIVSSGAMWGYLYTPASDVETVSLQVARSDAAPERWLYPLGDGWYVSMYRY